MQKDLHPKTEAVEMTCVSCGNKFTIKTTATDKDTLDVCSQCHPFYTGKTTSGSKAGRIEKFNQKFNAGSTAEAKTEETSEEE